MSSNSKLKGDISLRIRTTKIYWRKKRHLFTKQIEILVENLPTMKTPVSEGRYL